MASQTRLSDVFPSRKSSRLSSKTSSSKNENVSASSIQKKSKKSSRSHSKASADKSGVPVDCLLKKPSIPLSPAKLNTNSQSLDLLTPGSLKNSSPVKLGSASITSDIHRVKQQLLSPSKRKSDDSENVFPGCTSPIKSPRKDLHFPSCPLTPKSAKKATISSPLALNSTPRRLFESPDRLRLGRVGHEHSPNKSSVTVNLFQSPPASPAKLVKPNTRVYQSTKKSLHTAKPTRLIGREEERKRMGDFISERVQRKSSGSLYISGAPGTGKTAVITHILDELKVTHSHVKQGYVNCMSLKDSQGVFCNLYEQLTGSPMKGKDAMKSLEKLFVSSSSSVILVLDEIDQLDSKHQHILYRIFEWPAMAKSRLILLGIANALDLTDRVLPRLQASETCRPDLMNFAPYTQSQIFDILKSRLEKDQIVEPSAIKFCARKVSAVAGDIRKALDVCRRAVEMVEADVRTQTVFKSSDCSPSKKKLDAPVKKVTLVQINKVMSNIYGSSVSAASSTDSDFPLQQKIAVCSLLVLVKSGKKFKEVELGKLHETYSKVCRRQQIASVDQSEFHSICLLLESRGVVSMKKAKDTRLIKVSLKLDEQELEQTLKDKTLMSQILQSGV